MSGGVVVRIAYIIVFVISGSTAQRLFGCANDALAKYVGASEAVAISEIVSITTGQGLDRSALGAARVPLVALMAV